MSLTKSPKTAKVSDKLKRPQQNRWPQSLRWQLSREIFRGPRLSPIRLNQRSSIFLQILPRHRTVRLDALLLPYQESLSPPPLRTEAALQNQRQPKSPSNQRPSLLSLLLYKQGNPRGRVKRSSAPKSWEISPCLSDHWMVPTKDMKSSKRLVVDPR